MKKVLAVLLVVGIGGGVAYAVTRSPERSACMKLGELCGAKNGTVEDLNQCVDEMKQFRKIAGDEAVDKGVKCVDEAKTCGEAAGCVAGAGVKGIQGVMNDFFKGFGKGVQ